MDITPTSTLHPKSPEPELENPTRVQPHPAKHSSFSNGFLKRRHHHLNHHVPIVVTYKECLKNHAAALGGHAVDGCGEFMPSPTATPTDPTSLKCAACGCHRNFHRREPDEHHSPPPAPTPTTATIEFQPLHRHHPPPPPTRSPNSSSPPPISSSFYPHMLLSLSTGDVTGTPSTKKRFRTKFSETQKEKMFRFAEKLEWKIQKQDDDLIREFCNEVKVDRGVFKVWMHNNKNTMGRRALLDGVINGNNPTVTPTPTTAPVSISNRSDVDNGNGNSNSNESEDSGEQQQQQQQFITVEVTNGGFSSS